MAQLVRIHSFFCQNQTLTQLNSKRLYVIRVEVRYSTTHQQTFQYSRGPNASLQYFTRWQGPFKNNGVKQTLIIFNKNIKQAGAELCQAQAS